MTPQERKVMGLALEALKENQHLVADNERHAYVMEYNSIIEKCEEALAKPEQEPVAWEQFYPDIGKPKFLAQPEQEPVAWKLVPIEPTREMLEAMDECSIEGYDEHLYAGHATSVYMAAIDVAPTPPQPKEPEQEPVTLTNTILRRTSTPQPRKPLTDEQIGEIGRKYEKFDNQGNEFFARWGFARAIEAAHGIKE